MQTCIIKWNKSKTALMLLLLYKSIQKTKKLLTAKIYEWNLIS